MISSDLQQYQDLPVASCATAFIFYEAGSWMLSFPFYCLDLSYDGFTGVLVSKDPGSDPCDFLESTGEYLVQIDPTNKELIFPQTRIRLESIEKDQSNLKVVCSFIDRSREIMEAVNQIKLTST